MQPIAPLMIEHRLIERMIFILSAEIERIKKSGKVDPSMIDTAVDFIRFYADRTHHGKEEDILFRELKKKDLSKTHKAVMDDLLVEHELGRKMTKSLIVAKDWHLKGDKGAIKDVIECIQALVEFYPKHILKEDTEFFIPVMSYFTAQEKADMLAEFHEFDRMLVHERFDHIVGEIEKAKGLPGRKMKADWFKFI
jgi:hemerythrin-like domain-containing protein